MIYDESGKPIENPDLTLGYVTEQTVVSEDSAPIDDVTKFAWADDDYETRRVYVPYTEDELARRADAARRAEREAWLESAPGQMADMDELLVSLYESQLETDEALVAIYEGGI